MKNIFLIIITIGTLLFSCNRDPITTTNFIITNSSGYNVKLKVFNAEIQWRGQNYDTTFNLFNNQSINNSFESKGSNNGINYHKPFGESADSSYITFNDTLRIVYRKNDSKLRNILHVESYLETKNNDKLLEYQYYISVEDYDNAKVIK